MHGISRGLLCSLTLSALFILGFFLPSIAFSVGVEELYQDIARQLQEDKPLVVTSYIGLWYDNNHDPERNLYWGNMGGHDFLFRNSRSIENLPERYWAGTLRDTAIYIKNAVVGNLRNHEWERIYIENWDADPIRIAVFKTTVRPVPFWESKGVSRPFILYNVKHLRHSRRLEICELLKAVEKP